MFMTMSKTLDEEKEKIHLEPNTFDLGSETNGNFGVCSDSFSFWDTNHEELSASGNGGMKQMYSYASIFDDSQQDGQIYTPQEESKSSNQGMTLEQLQQQRQNEL